MLKTSSPPFHPFPLATTRSVEAAKAMGVAFNSSARIFTAAGRTLFTAWVASWTSLEIGWGFEDLLYGYAIFFQVWMMQWCRAFQPWAKSSMVSNATAAKGEVLPYGKMATCHGKSWEATATRMAKKYWVSDVHCLIAPSWANDVFVDGEFATNLRSTCQCALEHVFREKSVEVQTILSHKVVQDHCPSKAWDKLLPKPKPTEAELFHSHRPWSLQSAVANDPKELHNLCIQSSLPMAFGLWMECPMLMPNATQAMWPASIHPSRRMAARFDWCTEGIPHIQAENHETQRLDAKIPTKTQYIEVVSLHPNSNPFPTPRNFRANWAMALRYPRPQWVEKARPRKPALIQRLAIVQPAAPDRARSIRSLGVLPNEAWQQHRILTMPTNWKEWITMHDIPWPYRWHVTYIWYMMVIWNVLFLWRNIYR